MIYEQFNLGFIFNQLPNLLAKGMNCFTSESDLLVKLARELRQDPSITHDRSIFRKIRNSETNDKLTNELVEFLDFNGKMLPMTPIEEIDLKTLGAWFLVDSMVNGFKANRFYSSDTDNKYFDFIHAHCELEQTLITELFHHKDVTQINSNIQKWLLTEIKFPVPSVEERASYFSKLTMYVCALIELGLEALNESDVNSILNKVLPRHEITKKDHLLIPSSEILLEKTKAGWAKYNYGKEKISWEQFYRDILTAQAKDEALINKYPKYAEIDIIDPDTKAIKKRFQRWRAGDLFTLEDFRIYLAILRLPYKDSKQNLGLECYFLVNIFTYVQSDLIKNGIHPRDIADLFSRYPEYKVLVNSRFKEFKLSGVLNP
ncbi:hypothetical protein CBQ28_01175 [Pseudoalteromonas sp. GCY]|uniref:hypothetical protein n=1 Tax=Pseudoalteromonas sp. GCY TaxID=2003316 RepID=UPI000BFEB15F|nr:hypothetical protein [Pseudoalteromonas sp. GCY]PHI39162.1 hypothetical protein CBQ28_01175 [Pseudoalteromonas sp. GCY]QQQ65116.1 hypothetical protein JJQ94_00540 [Pseudoalteromonas sp. GCY]